MSDDIDDIRDELRAVVAKGYNALPGVGQPVFAHDCPACVFLGRYESHDLYFCGKVGDPLATIIARFGNDGPEYCSGLDFGIRPNPQTTFARTMRVAYLIAADAGLVRWMSPTGRLVRAPWDKAPVVPFEVDSAPRRKW